jgi:hypothetical protein
MRPIHLPAVGGTLYLDALCGCFICTYLTGMHRAMKKIEVFRDVSEGKLIKVTLKYKYSRKEVILTMVKNGNCWMNRCVCESTLTLESSGRKREIRCHCEN